MILSNINMLYLGAMVLILMDFDYLKRFWTQFEAWVSFQEPTADGLVPAPEHRLRCHVECMHGTPIPLVPSMLPS